MADVTMTVPQLISRAQQHLDRLRHLQPTQREFTGLAQAAIADTLTAIAITLNGGDSPAIPGLPGGWRLASHQSPVGSRLWAFGLTGPDGNAHDSKFMYGTPGAAVAAGIDRARKLAGEDG